MVIIDTPGIGGSSSITLESMQKYLESSFGVVYVLNSSSAGGVQKGRVSYGVQKGWVSHSVQEGKY